MITVAVRWYLRYGLSYREVEELLAERGIGVDHVTVYRWVQRFTPLLADAAQPLPYLRVLDELVPAAAHVTEQYGNNRIEADHGRLKARLRPMRGLNTSAPPHESPPATPSFRTFATDVPPTLRLATAFSELALAM